MPHIHKSKFIAFNPELFGWTFKGSVKEISVRWGRNARIEQSGIKANEWGCLNSCDVTGRHFVASRGIRGEEKQQQKNVKKNSFESIAARCSCELNVHCVRVSTNSGPSNILQISSVSRKQKMMHVFYNFFEYPIFQFLLIFYSDIPKKKNI